MKEAISFFYEQLPQNVGNQVKNYYQTQKEKGLLGDTLGGMKTALKDWVEQECNQHKARNEAAIELCCKKQDTVG